MRRVTAYYNTSCLDCEPVRPNRVRIGPRRCAKRICETAAALQLADLPFGVQTIAICVRNQIRRCLCVCEMPPACRLADSVLDAQSIVICVLNRISTARGDPGLQFANLHVVLVFWLCNAYNWSSFVFANWCCLRFSLQMIFLIHNMIK